MIQLSLFLLIPFLGQLSATQPDKQPAGSLAPAKSAYFAFVDHDYIFTIEAVKPGVFLLNFVSMTDGEAKLYAKYIQLTLENRKAAAKLLIVETGNYTQSMAVGSMTIHPRSSFGVRLSGDFGNAKEIFGATIRLGEEDLKLTPLTSFDFELLVAKVNRLNLESPDFYEDWRVLRMERLGTRSPAHK